MGFVRRVPAPRWSMLRVSGGHEFVVIVSGKLRTATEASQFSGLSTETIAIASIGGYLVAMENETTTDAPRPTWLQVALAIFVMALATWSISKNVMNVEGNFGLIPSAIYSGGVSLLLLVSQYGGMFRHWRAGLVIVMVMLSLSLVGASVALVATLTAILCVPSTFTVVLIWVTMIVFILIALALRSNWRWYKTLAEAKSNGNLLNQQSSFSLIELLGAMLILACIIGPASYRAGTNQSLYAEDISPADAPFPAPSTAEPIMLRRDRDGAIRAHWFHFRADLDAWLAERSSSAEIENFKLRDVTNPADVRQVTRSSPRGPTSIDVMIREGKEATWDQGDRHVRVVWQVMSDGFPITVYYHETRNE